MVFLSPHDKQGIDIGYLLAYKRFFNHHEKGCPFKEEPVTEQSRPSTPSAAAADSPPPSQSSPPPSTPPAKRRRGLRGRKILLSSPFQLQRQKQARRCFHGSLSPCSKGCQAYSYLQGHLLRSLFTFATVSNSPFLSKYITPGQ